MSWSAGRFGGWCQDLGLGHSRSARLHGFARAQSFLIINHLTYYWIEHLLSLESAPLCRIGRSPDPNSWQNGSNGIRSSFPRSSAYYSSTAKCWIPSLQSAVAIPLIHQSLQKPPNPIHIGIHPSIAIDDPFNRQFVSPPPPRENPSADRSESNPQKPPRTCKGHSQFLRILSNPHRWLSKQPRKSMGLHMHRNQNGEQRQAAT